MSDELASQIAKTFIARRNAKAIQLSNGEYHLHTRDGKRDSERLPWKMGDLRAHLSKERTFGHYLLNEESNCKLFAFDIDLAKSGFLPTGGPDWSDFQVVDDLRAAWLRRDHPGRSWLKYQFHSLAHKLAAAVVTELEIPTAVAYSGGKGVHVYGFTGLMHASDVREGAQVVLDSVGDFEPLKGQHFFKHVNQDPEEGYPNLTIEVFPKQTSLDGKDLGNLMRLPLGRNQKSKDPTFFMDMRAPLGEMVQRDPMEAMTVGNPWS